MLVLSRKINENIIIDGRIIVKVVRTEGNYVKLGIDAPPDVPVHRQEIFDEIQRANQGALATGRPRAPKLPKRVLAEQEARRHEAAQGQAGASPSAEGSSSAPSPSPTPPPQPPTS